MAIKVYGWTGRRSRAEFADHFPDERNLHNQTREVVAARSKAEVYRIGGGRKGDYFNLCETGNSGEIADALASPGVILWRPLDAYKAPRVPATKRYS